ncbi:MAG: hypothetical protein HKN63_01635 [Rhodobacteraceae bacterium]|nr:hypothetical protein [Paracoccaceae bacterium]
MYMGATAVLFAIFFLNVFLGATGQGTYLSEVQEMLLLSVSMLFFVAAILKREAAAKKSNDK